jgi:RNase P protein component
LRYGKRFSGNYFSMAYEPAGDLKYGIFVSKKHGSAPVRNRIKRLFREAIRLDVRPSGITGKFAILPGIVDKKTKAGVIRFDVCRVFENLRGGQ